MAQRDKLDLELRQIVEEIGKHSPEHVCIHRAKLDCGDRNHARNLHQHGPPAATAATAATAEAAVMY